MKLLTTILNIGITPNLSKGEKKLVKLLNFICFLWQIMTTVFVVSDYFLQERYLVLFFGYAYQYLTLITVQVLQWKTKYFAARIFFVSTAFGGFFLFSNFLALGALVELFYILIPLFSLMFLKDRLN